MLGMNGSPFGCVSVGILRNDYRVGDVHPECAQHPTWRQGPQGGQKSKEEVVLVQADSLLPGCDDVSISVPPCPLCHHC